MASGAPVIGAPALTAARQRVGPFMARGTHEDLVVLKELAEAGKLTPAIDRVYPLREVPDGLRYVGTRGVRGKVVIRVA